jgi:uncharacterized protein (TIGR02996 family)
VTGFLAILVRSGGSASGVAGLMAERLGFHRRPDLGPGLVVTRSYPDDGFILFVEDQRPPVAPWSGYDVAITGEYGDEMLARELFDEFRALRLPAALRSGPAILRSIGTRPASLTAITGVPLPPAPADVREPAWAAIMADPDSDEPRLAYADRIGGRHARLIRRQIAFVRDRQRHRPWNHYSSEAEELRELVEEWRPRLIPQALRDLPATFTLRRGFPDEVRMSAADYPAAAATLAAAVPLQSLVLTEAPPGSLARLARVPELARLRAVSLPPTGDVGDAGLAELIASPYLTGLRWLSIDGSGVTEAGVAALAAATTVPQLQFVSAGLELRLQPEACYDYLGAHVWTNPATLAEELGRRHPSAAWLQRGDRDFDTPGYEDV